MTAPFVTPSRDALALAIHQTSARCVHPDVIDPPCEVWADALLASGVVRAAASLADDEWKP